MQIWQLDIDHIRQFSDISMQFSARFLYSLIISLIII